MRGLFSLLISSCCLCAALSLDGDWCSDWCCRRHFVCAIFIISGGGGCLNSTGGGFHSWWSFGSRLLAGFGRQIMGGRLRRADMFSGLFLQQFSFIAGELQMELLADGTEFVTDDGNHSFRRRLGMPVHGQGKGAEIGADASEVAIGPAFVEALVTGNDDGALKAVGQFVQQLPELPTDPGISSGSIGEDVFQTINYHAMGLLLAEGFSDTVQQIDIDMPALQRTCFLVEGDGMELAEVGPLTLQEKVSTLSLPLAAEVEDGPFPVLLRDPLAQQSQQSRFTHAGVAIEEDDLIAG